MENIKPKQKIKKREVKKELDRYKESPDIPSKKELLRFLELIKHASERDVHKIRDKIEHIIEQKGLYDSMLELIEEKAEKEGMNDRYLLILYSMIQKNIEKSMQMKQKIEKILNPVQDNEKNEVLLDLHIFNDQTIETLKEMIKERDLEYLYENFKYLPKKYKKEILEYTLELGESIEQLAEHIDIDKETIDLLLNNVFNEEVLEIIKKLLEKKKIDINEILPRLKELLYSEDSYIKKDTLIILNDALGEYNIDNKIMAGVLRALEDEESKEEALLLLIRLVEQYGIKIEDKKAIELLAKSIDQPTYSDLVKEILIYSMNETIEKELAKRFDVEHLDYSLEVSELLSETSKYLPALVEKTVELHRKIKELLSKDIDNEHLQKLEHIKENLEQYSKNLILSKKKGQQ